MLEGAKWLTDTSSHHHGLCVTFIRSFIHACMHALFILSFFLSFIHSFNSFIHSFHSFIHSFMHVQALGIALKLTFAGQNQFGFMQTYFCILVRARNPPLLLTGRPSWLLETSGSAHRQLA